MSADPAHRFRIPGERRFGPLPVALGLLVLLATAPAFAQGAPPAAASAAPPAETQAPPKLTGEQLDELCAPIALYPDALLAQVLMASAYPLDVVAADRFMQKNGSLTGDKMEEALVNQPWDISVKTLTHFPSILKYMDENLDWTQALGDAFVNQQPDVMASVQHLRSEAYAMGNLQSNPQQTVTVADKNIVIAPTDGQTIYVPQYNPQVVYTQGPATVITNGGTTTVVTQPATTTVVTQSGYSSADMVTTGLLSFGAGILVGSLINSSCDWNHGYVYPPPYYGGGYYGWGRPPPGYGNNGWGGGYHNGNNNINIDNSNNINIGNGANKPWKPNNDRRPPLQNGRPGTTRPAARDFGYGSGVNGKPGAGAAQLPANIKPGNTKPGAGGAFSGYSPSKNTQQNSQRGQQSLGGNNKPGATKPAGGAIKPGVKPPNKPVAGAGGQNRGGSNAGGGMFGNSGNGSFTRNAGTRGGGSMKSAQQNGFKPQGKRK